MRRTTLARRTPLARTGIARRPGRALRQRPTVRDWDDAIAKRDSEGRCRVCGSATRLQSAHTVGRANDRPHPDGSCRLYVDPELTVPLCGTCHEGYDAHRLDLRPHLNAVERAAADAAIGAAAAERRLAGAAWRAEV